PGPPVELLDRSWLHGVLVMALVLPAVMLPALAASGRTIIAFKQERARTRSTALLWGLLVALLLLLPALYGYQQLRLQGMLGVPGLATSPDDPFRNPLLLLAPALFVFALAQLILHLFPLLLSLLSTIAGRLPGVALLLALRFLARSARAA